MIIFRLARFFVYEIHIKSIMTLTAKDATQKNANLIQCITHAQHEGYKENFRVSAQGLTTEDGNSVFSHENVHITNFYRFEGYSDPGDSSILYLIETSNKTKGILVDAYDTYADARISRFIKQVKIFRSDHSIGHGSNPL